MVEEMTHKSFLLQLFSSTGRQNSRIPKAKFLFGHANSTSRSCIWMILILRGNFFRWKFTFQVNFFRFKTKICQRLPQFWVLSSLMLELVSCYSILYGFWWYFCRNWNLFLLNIWRFAVLFFLRSFDFYSKGGLRHFWVSEVHRSLE